MIGVAGDDESTARFASRLAAAGAAAHRGPVADLVEADPDVVVAIGGPALVDLLCADLDAPVLPVETGPGLPSVGADDVEPVAEALADARYETRTQRRLAVAVDGEPVPSAAFDVLLVRSEPGRISEYAWRAAGRRSRFRADGVVVTTPAGSHGYASAAGGPRLGLDLDAVAVVPVAAFGYGAPNWVVDPADGLELAVVREEGAVSVLVDGRACRTLAGRTRVSLGPGAPYEVVVLPESAPASDAGP